MKDIKRYSGGLTREQFLYFEIRTVAALLCEGHDRSDIMNIIAKDNLFQFPTERMIRSMTNVCLRRIDALDSETLTFHLANASPDVSRQINLYAIMRENAIVYDFMVDVIGEKFRTQQLSFSVKDINVFFEELTVQYPPAAEWTETTLKKLRQVLTRFLVECGYLESTRSTELIPVFLFPELEEGIRLAGDLPALCAFNCFV